MSNKTKKKIHAKLIRDDLRDAHIVTIRITARRDRHGVFARVALRPVIRRVVALHAHAQGLANARRREQNHCHRHGQNQHLLHFRILSDLMESVNWVSFGMGLSYTHSAFKSTKLQ